MIYKKLKIRGTTHDLRQMPPHLTLTVSAVSHTDRIGVLFALKSPFGQFFPPRSQHPRLSVEKGVDLLFFFIGLNIYYIIRKCICQDGLGKYLPFAIAGAENKILDFFPLL